MSRPGEFSQGTRQEALLRQKNHCASCGMPIFGLGNSGQGDHKFGEGAQAHHVIHIKSGGTAAVDNCVILCKSCHYSAHEGGNYRFGNVVGKRSAFPHFNG
jgi:5-methylcytosine-specific restriction endonuclease McrA